MLLYTCRSFSTVSLSHHSTISSSYHQHDDDGYDGYGDEEDGDGDAADADDDDAQMQESHVLHRDVKGSNILLTLTAEVGKSL